MSRIRLPFHEAKVLEVRELTKADIGRLREPRSAVPLKQLRYSHHKVALLDAAGMSVGKITEATGYTTARIYQLRKDPAYAMLVAEKRIKVEEKELEVITDLMNQKILIMAAADRHLYDQISELDDQGELLPIKQALAISADMADRVGYGKHTSQTHHDGDFAARMEATLLRSGRTAKLQPQPQVLEARIARSAEPIDATWLAPVVEFQPPQAVSAGASTKRSGSESPSPSKLLPQPFRRRF